MAKKIPGKLGRGILQKATTKLRYVDDPFDTNGALKPNVTYRSGKPGTSIEYRYTTDSKGRINTAQAKPLKLDNSGRVPHQSNTPGKRKGDHAGHLFGDRFGGSPELDNLVSQASSVNQSEFKKFENNWAKQLEAGKSVDVDIEVHYGDGPRPTGFTVTEVIDGKRSVHDIANVNSGRK